VTPRQVHIIVVALSKNCHEQWNGKNNEPELKITKFNLGSSIFSLLPWKIHQFLHSTFLTCRNKGVLKISSFKMWYRPVAPLSQGNLLEMQILGLSPIKFLILG
jgi:hypothetical protein